ncbi:MAG: apolipoprotein N-acyltransferase [Ignavibacteria bacterium]|jgi:apolipoprotein N-acyltransferase
MTFLKKYFTPKSEEEKKKLKRDGLLLILSGIILGISFPPFPFPLTLLIFAGFVPFLFVLENRNSLAQINRATYLLSFVFCIITVYWVGSWQSEADPFLMMGGGVLLFALPAVMIIPSTLYYLTVKIFNKNIAFWMLPVFWVTGEYLLTLTDLKFPWLVLGNGLAKFTTFIQFADVIGAFGLSLIVFYINLFLFKGIKSYKEGNLVSKYSIIAITIFILFVVYGVVSISKYEHSQKEIKVGIIQPDLNPWEKWQQTNLQELVDNYIKLSQRAVDEGAKIIFWPETALPVYLMQNMYRANVESIRRFLEKNDVPLLTGMPYIKFFIDSSKAPSDAKYNAPGKYYYITNNAIILLEPNKREYQHYGKMHLVPLGEHVPFVEQFSFLADFLKWGVGISGWNVGKDTVVFKTSVEIDNVIQEINICGLVCYESIFPLFAPNFIQRGAEFIAVVTNDSWYGNSSGPYQHKEFAVLRAVENRRSVIRCANGGISCIINPLGETIAETEMFNTEVLVGIVPLQNELTFYSDNPWIVTAIISIISVLVVVLNIILFLKRKFKH